MKHRIGAMVCVAIGLFIIPIVCAQSRDTSGAKSVKERVFERTKAVQPIFQEPQTILPPALRLDISVTEEEYFPLDPSREVPSAQICIRNIHHGAVCLYCSSSPRVSLYLRFVSVSFNKARLEDVPNASELVVDVGSVIRERADKFGVVRINAGESIKFSIPIAELFWPVVPPSDFFCISSELRSTNWGGPRALPMDGTVVHWRGRSVSGNPVVVRVFEP